MFFFKFFKSCLPQILPGPFILEYFVPYTRGLRIVGISIFDISLGPKDAEATTGGVLEKKVFLIALFM